MRCSHNQVASAFVCVSSAGDLSLSFHITMAAPMYCVKCDTLKEHGDFLSATEHVNEDAMFHRDQSVCDDCSKAHDTEQKTDQMLVQLHKKGSLTSSSPPVQPPAVTLPPQQEECKVVDTVMCTRCGTACTICSATEYVIHFKMELIVERGHHLRMLCRVVSCRVVLCWSVPHESCVGRF
jgi:hypothetical protein